MGRVQSVAIIAEDNSDVDAIKIFVQRISRVSNISFRKKVGHGGGKVISKCLAWSNDLYSLGCDLLIVVHDQDSFEFTELQRTIENRLSASCFRNRIICIPTQELEAWFLGDPQSIKSFFKLKRLPKIAGHPESINSPKEFLREQVKRHSDGSAIYLHTRHNVELAKCSDLNSMRQRCPSFKGFAAILEQQSFS